jgi:hypothetical protein
MVPKKLHINELYDILFYCMLSWFLKSHRHINELYTTQTYKTRKQLWTLNDIMMRQPSCSIKATKESKQMIIKKNNNNDNKNK